MTRVRNEVAAKATEPVRVTEFLKPGFEEIASVLPPPLGRGLMGWAQKSEKRMRFNFAMRVRTDTVFGFVRLWGLAKMKPLRPRTYRYAEENREIGTWLDGLRAAAGRGYGLALEIAELPNLRKGYSDTHRRGTANYRQVFEQIVLPAARGNVDALWAEQAVKRARQAELTYPDGDALANTLAALGAERTAAPVRAAAE
jgi:indolepyruvate ferredoxin oxidoreductase beta subunit